MRGPLRNPIWEKLSSNNIMTKKSWCTSIAEACINSYLCARGGTRNEEININSVVASITTGEARLMGS